MGAAIPVIHRFQALQRMLDRKFRAFGQHIELCVGDQRGDLDDAVVVRVQPGHFQVNPDQMVVANKTHGGTARENRR